MPKKTTCNQEAEHLNNSTKELLATVARSEIEKILGGNGPVFMVKLATKLANQGDYYRAAKIMNDAFHFVYPSTKAQDATQVAVENDNVLIYLPAKEPPPGEEGADYAV